MKATPKEKAKIGTRFQLRIRLNMGEASTSNPSSSTQKSKAQNWRDRLKDTDPQKYKSVKKASKEYSRLYRLRCSTSQLRPKRNLSEEEQEELLLWQKRRELNNASARERMRRMNERKKAQALKSGSAKKHLTRNQHDKLTEKERLKKRRQRAIMSQDRKSEILAKRREKYHRQRAEVKEKHLEDERKRLEKIAIELAEKELALQEHIKQHALDVRTPNAKAKALERARKALPRRRSHCINTSIDLIVNATPTKAAAFKRVGIQGNCDNSGLDEAIVNAVTEGLSNLPKHSIKRKSLASSLSGMKRFKLQRAASRKFGVTRKLLANAIKRVAGRKPISLATILKVTKFYEDKSRILPDKKLVSKKSFKPRHILETSVLDLYKIYTLENPDHRIGTTSFYRLRPKHVKLRSQAKYIGCLCEYCENINLKMSLINHTQPGTFRNLYDVSDSTMCSKPIDSEFHIPACIKRECGECGVNQLDHKLSAFDQTRPLEWKRWEMMETQCHTNKETKTVKKRGLIMKAGTFNEFMEELKVELQPFSEHLFTKDWQHKQQCLLQKSLQSDEVSSVFDFAENYTCYYQHEVQSAHYTQESATVHPVVTYYLCTQCNHQVTESCVMISNDLNHDYNLVYKFQEVVTEHLTGNRKIPLKKFYRFSDGCSSQYKSKGPISDISYDKKDFGMTIHHNYSGTRHGKGASDGESGVVKRYAEEAVKAGAANINDAKSLYEYLRANMTKESEDMSCCTPFRRTIFYVPFEDVRRDRPDRAVRTVPGTRKLHSIKGLKDGVVATRNLSCFCGACKRGVGTCQNAMYVKPWRIVQLHSRVTSTGMFRW